MAHNNKRECQVVHEINSLVQLISCLCELLRALLRTSCTMHVQYVAEKFKVPGGHRTLRDRIRSDYQPAITGHRAAGVWNSSAPAASACPLSPAPRLLHASCDRSDDPIDSATPTPTPILNAQRLPNTQTIREIQCT